MSQRSFYASWGCGGGRLVLLSLFLYNRMVVCVLSLFFFAPLFFTDGELSALSFILHPLIITPPVLCVSLFPSCICVLLLLIMLCVLLILSVTLHSTHYFSPPVPCPDLLYLFELPMGSFPLPGIYYTQAPVCQAVLLWDRVLLETSALFLFYLLSLVRITDSNC